MIWLAAQVWPLLLLAFVVGLGLTVALGQRSRTVEEWEEVPVQAPKAAKSAKEPRPAKEPKPAKELKPAKEPRPSRFAVPGRGRGAAPPPPAPTEPEVAAEDAPTTSAPSAPSAPVPPTAPTGAPAPAAAAGAADASDGRPAASVDDDSPFPVREGVASWEQEELWSRPARVGPGGEAKKPTDEWSEAAQNWRAWADEATGRGFGGADDRGTADTGADPSDGRDPWVERLSPTDRDLFAADRDAGETGPASPPAGGTVGPDTSRPSWADEDVFPHARPVEAPAPSGEAPGPAGGAGQAGPTQTDEQDEDDDEREAAEIRRLREQSRRDDD